MNITEIIKTRKSVRTFDGRAISTQDKERLCDYMATITNPYDIEVEFVWLDAKEHGLSSPVIVGEKSYIATKVKNKEYCEEAFGYSFEKLVLYAWSLGIGTTWIGGTMNRKLFETAANTGEDEFMMIVTPIGYPSKTRSDVDKKLRQSVYGDDRLPVKKLFFDRDFSTPLTDEKILELLEVVRWAPSAANKQPWRVVKEENKYHFYEECSIEYRSTAGWDVQKVDVGITICHFMSVTDGKFSISDPGIPVNKDTQYIATVSI